MVPSGEPADWAVEIALKAPVLQGGIWESGVACGSAKRYPGCRGEQEAEGSSEERWWLFRLATGSQEFRSCNGTVFGRQFLLSLPLSLSLYPSLHPSSPAHYQEQQ